jgi:hypothetical protein
MKEKQRTTVQANARNKPIAPGDLRNLLRAYSGAIELDQIRVDALPPSSFHPEYSRGMWLRWRRRHIDFINQLLRTTRDMSQQLLQNLNLVAGTREPKVVRNAVVELLGMGAAESLTPGQIDTAPLFLAALVDHVGVGWITGGANVNARTRLERWLEPIDPLSVAEDPECGVSRESSERQQ